MVWRFGGRLGYRRCTVRSSEPKRQTHHDFPEECRPDSALLCTQNTGRPLKEGKWFEKFRSNYLDVDNDALYPFGYGLSYTTFRFSDVTLSQPSIGMDNQLVASVTVTNTGDRAGSEVVQLYIRDLVGSVTRPVKELKGFEKIYLQPNESRTVRFTIAPEMLKFYNADLQFVAEPGDFDVMIGPDSQNVKTARFTLR